jgi:hypothetical protein
MSKKGVVVRGAKDMAPLDLLVLKARVWDLSHVIERAHAEIAALNQRIHAAEPADRTTAG